MALNGQVLIVGGKRYGMDVHEDGRVVVVPLSGNPPKPTGD